MARGRRDPLPVTMSLPARPLSREIAARLATTGMTTLGFWSFPLFLTAVLGLIASIDFVIFHTLAELFAISVALVMFSLSWYTKDFTRNHFLLFLACGYFWVGVLDLAHTLSYKGLEIMPRSGTNASSQFWIVTRFYEAALLFLAPILATRSFAKESLLAANGTVAIALGALVMSGGLPDTFVEGSGLTPFKIGSEVAIILILAGAAVILLRRRDLVEPDELTLLVASIALTAAAEATFMVYVDPHGLANLIGHIFKLCSFWLIFQAIVASNLRKPYIDLQDAVTVAGESRRSAEQANRAKSDFLSMMSHDLRTPLNAIIGFSDMMRLQTLGPLGNPKYAEYTEAITKSGAQLVDLINDILDVSRIESGTYALHEEAVAIRPLLADIGFGFDRAAPLGKHAVRLDIADDAPRLLADRRALSQIATNLIGNAVRFSEPGSEIVIEWRPGSAGRWELCVRDHGCGIPADQIGRITEPFVQGHPHLSRQHRGVGLGLHIVRLLAELHGATLCIDSVEGRGTAVHVAFPGARIVAGPGSGPGDG